MRIWEILSETPVSDFELKGDFDSENQSNFSKKDKNLLKSSKHIERIKKAFSNTPYIFGLYFLNTSKYNIDDAPGFGPDFDKVASKVAGMRTVNDIDNLLPGTDIKPKSNEITVVFLSNSNEEHSMPLTPWILAHRFAHALTDGANNGSIGDIKKILLGFTTMFDNLKTSLEYLSPQDYLTMKSARDGKLIGTEDDVELIAQFLINGKVTFKLSDTGIKAIKTTDFFDEPPNIHETKIKETKLYLEKAEKEINVILKMLMDACVGNLFITV